MISSHLLNNVFRYALPTNRANGGNHRLYDYDIIECHDGVIITWYAGDRPFIKHITENFFINTRLRGVCVNLDISLFSHEYSVLQVGIQVYVCTYFLSFPVCVIEINLLFVTVTN